MQRSVSQALVVSVIVAAYNAEMTIRKCLDSLSDQTLLDFEVIVVDDGSTDNMPIILDEYAKKDNRVKVIHQTNGGVAVARQTGLNAARGEYTIFVDADDWVEPDMLQEMYNAITTASADLLICDYYEVYEDKEVLNIQKPEPADRLSVFGQMLNNLAGSLWNKLIRRDLYSRFGVGFDSRIRDEEDKLICLKLLSHDISVAYLGKAFYHYDQRFNPNALTQKKYAVAPRIRILDEISEVCDLSLVQRYFDNAVFYIAYQGLFVTEKEDRTYRDMFIKYKSNLLHADYPLHNKALVLLRLLGIKVPVKLLKTILGNE